jgi:hypothetical protein
MLVVLVGVLVAATGLFVTLFVLERTAAGAAGERVAVAERELADARDRLAANRSTMDELAAERQGLESANDALRVCADPARSSIEAATTGTDEDLSSAIQRMLALCGR